MFLIEATLSCLKDIAALLAGTAPLFTTFAFSAEQAIWSCRDTRIAFQLVTGHVVLSTSCAYASTHQLHYVLTLGQRIQTVKHVTCYNDCQLS